MFRLNERMCRTIRVFPVTESADGYGDVSEGYGEPISVRAEVQAIGSMAVLAPGGDTLGYAAYGAVFDGLYFAFLTEPVGKVKDGVSITGGDQPEYKIVAREEWTDYIRLTLRRMVTSCV